MHRRHFAMLCHALSPCSQHVGYVSLVAAFGVCYWRGVWYLWEELVFCETLAGKSAMAMVLGVGILLATGNFQTTVVGPPILFPTTSPKVEEEEDSLTNNSHSEEFEASSEIAMNNLDSRTTTEITT
jgi:hypothetical protein